MEEQYITGYSYSPIDRKYIGEYDFPNNKDKDEIHVPPNTTLEKPMPGPGQDAFFINGAWEYRDAPVPQEHIPGFGPDDDYSLLMPSFIEAMKAQGLWTPEVEAKYQADVEAAKQREILANQPQPTE